MDLDVIAASPLTASRRTRIAMALAVALVASLLSVVAPEPANAVVTTISGNVKGAQGGGNVNLSGASVRLYDNQWFLGSTETDVNGNYTLTVPGTGNYRLGVSAATGQNYISEFYSDKYDFGLADFIPVVEGTSQTGRDFVLLRGGRIFGKASTNSGATPLAGIEVAVYGTSNKHDWRTYATTDSNGNFAAVGLRSGNYRVFFSDPSFTYAQEWWNNGTTWASATNVAVEAGTDTTGIEAVLQLGSTVSGTVRNASAAPLAGAQVTAYLGDDVINSSAITTSNGQYTITGLPAASYTLKFESVSANWATEWWNNQPSKASAGTFAVGQDVDLTGYDATLAVGASIEGDVYDSYGNPIEFAAVALYDASFATETPIAIVDVGYTDEFGDYSIDKLPQGGNYKLGFVYGATSYDYVTGQLQPSTDGLLSQWYSNKYSFATAATTAISSPGMLVTGIDVVLQYGPHFADVGDPASAVYPSIQWMYEQNISTGTTQPSGLPLYNPSASVSRQAMASFLYKLSGETFAPPATASFADVAVGSPFFTAIEWMKSTGISTGTPQPSGLPLFKPADPVSRQAMATFLARYAHVDLSTVPTTQDFADVPLSASTASAIHWMKATGISTGTPQPSGLPLYKPADPVSRQAMAVFLYRLAHLA